VTLRRFLPSRTVAAQFGTGTASATTSDHACGGTLLFVRDADGSSRERCSGCAYTYEFADEPSARTFFGPESAAT